MGSSCQASLALGVRKHYSVHENEKWQTAHDETKAGQGQEEERKINNGESHGKAVEAWRRCSACASVGYPYAPDDIPHEVPRVDNPDVSVNIVVGDEYATGPEEQ
jgi:hypothetical protein